MKIKNLEEALICFKENAIIHGECTQNGDNKRGNKSHKNIINAIKYISALNPIIPLSFLTISFNAFTAFGVLTCNSA